jgi:hypothetical protein
VENDLNRTKNVLLGPVFLLPALTVRPEKESDPQFISYRDSTRKKIYQKRESDACLPALHCKAPVRSKGKGARTLHYVAPRDDDWRVGWE